MRRSFATLAAAAMFALALSATPVLAGSPAVHGEILFGDLGSVTCGTHTYTPTAGKMVTVMHLGTSDVHATMTLTARDLTVTRDGQDSYRVVGVEHFTGAPTSSVYIQVFKLRVLGTADNINVVVHALPNGDFKYFDFGSCPLQ